MADRLSTLRAWGDQLRADRVRRRRLCRRIALVGIGITALGLTIAFPPLPRLVWNATASAPIGLYAVSSGEDIAVGDMVIARVPDPWRLMAARRRYIPANVPLVKRVVAGPGNEICALGPDIFVDGERVTARQTNDGAGRIMPWWSGCLRLHAGQYFLLMPGRTSFDGRYFGVTDEALVVGKARLLWAR